VLIGRGADFIIIDDPLKPEEALSQAHRQAAHPEPRNDHIGKLKSNPACRTACLDGGSLITVADLQAGLKMYNVTLREADAVFIHTGWEDLFLQWPAQNATYNKSEPGIGEAAAEWLAAQKVILVGSDSWAIEVIPGEEESIAFPVHKTLITDNGIHIVENVRTDLIAAQAAQTGEPPFS
jgi:kynurenine formamidase